MQGAGAFDERAFPRLAAYLRDLPAGLASHKPCQTKASLYVHALSERPLLPVVDSLPREIATLVERPLLVSSWAPAAPVQGLFLAIADHHRMTDDEFQQWAQDSQRTLFRGALYRALAMLPSPMLLLRGAEKRWSSFHRGTLLEVMFEAPGRAVASIIYPPNLYAPTNLRGFAGGIAAAGELSRARGIGVSVVSHTSTRARLVVTWEI